MRDILRIIITIHLSAGVTTIRCSTLLYHKVIATDTAERSALVAAVSDNAINHQFIVTFRCVRIGLEPWNI